MTYKCPVCFFPEMDSPPSDYEICPCCGTEFGLDDQEKSHDELRQDWIVINHCRWFSNYTAPPDGWDPAHQLGALISPAGK
jgi:hypothetical protein